MGRPKKPYRTYQKRYPRPLEKEIDKMVAEWKRENGLDAKAYHVSDVNKAPEGAKE